MLLLLIAYLIALIRANPDIGGGTHGGETSHLQVDDPDFSGIVDFSNAIPGPDGSWCITKTKYVGKLFSIYILCLLLLNLFTFFCLHFVYIFCLQITWLKIK